MAQLALLVFGVALGVQIAGEVYPQSPSAQMGAWSLYVAIVVVAIGLNIYLSAPRRSLPWIIAAIAVALVGQSLAGTVMSRPTPDSSAPSWWCPSRWWPRG